MSRDDDDRMLEELREALAPAGEQPSAAEISALRRAVAVQLSRPERPWWHRGLWRSWRPLRVLAVAAVLTFTGTAVAVSTGMPLPIVRSLARAVGLPVDSPALAGAKSAMRKLRDAMTEHETKAVQSAAADLRERLGALDAAERGLIATELEALLSESDRFLAAEAAQAKKPPRTRAVTGPGPTAGDDDEDPGDDSADIDVDGFDTDDDDDDGAESPEPGASDPDEPTGRKHRRDRAGHDEEPDDDRPGDSPDDDDDIDDDDENDSDL